MKVHLFDENRELWTLLHKACKPYGIDPDSGIIDKESGNSEVTQFLLKLIERYDGAKDNDALTAWLDQQIPQVFPALVERPKWIQNPNWPMAGGEPMWFVGQLEIAIRDKETAAKWFHDDTSIYIFISKHAPPEVIIQQF
jgi:hypothetical protein